MRWPSLFALGGSALATAYLTLWPVPLAPVTWTASEFAGYGGPFAVNERLAGLNLIDLGGEEGPEHIAFGPDGKLYTTVLSGNILRMNGDGSDREVFATTGGRVLGFDFDAAGNFIAADAYKGLLSIAPDRKVVMLTDHYGADPIRYANSVVVAKSGKIFFSDASTRFAPALSGGTFAASTLDILEQSATGRILEYDPLTGATRLLAKGLSFANGVALSADERHLFVNETGKYKVWKLAVSIADVDLNAATAPDPTLAAVLLDNLPGFPDNLMRGRNGRIWLGFAKPRSRVIDRLAGQPFLRKMFVRLPKAMWPIPPVYGHVMAFTEDGKVVADLQDPIGSYPETTGLAETADRLYVQSLHARGLGWLPAAVLAGR